MYFSYIFNFDSNRTFSNGYSLCIVAIFANFQNCLIFRILAVFFLAVFCMEQLYCASRVVFCIFFAISILTQTQHSSTPI